MVQRMHCVRARAGLHDPPIDRMRRSGALRSPSPPWSHGNHADGGDGRRAARRRGDFAERRGTWTLTAGGATLTLAARSVARLRHRPPRLQHPARRGRSERRADTTITRRRTAARVRQPGRRLCVRDGRRGTRGQSLQFDATFTLAAEASLRSRAITRIVSGSPTFEVWTTYAARRRRSPSSNLNALHIAVPAGTLNWLTGLQGDNADVQTDNAFTLQQQTLRNRPPLRARRARIARRRQSVFLVLDRRPQGRVLCRTDVVRRVVTYSIEPRRRRSRSSSAWGRMTTTLSGAVSTDRTRSLACAGGLPQAPRRCAPTSSTASAAGVRFLPLVTYNTWFAYGTGSTKRRCAPRWSTPRRSASSSSSSTPAGTRVPAPAGPSISTPASARGRRIRRDFQTALRRSRDYAHSLGMKFGLWVEPERVNLSLVGVAGRRGIVAGDRGRPVRSDHAAQICLASEAAQQWVIDRLTTLIDEVQPDYLKWDNNMFVNCDRDGHGHGAATAISPTHPRSTTCCRSCARAIRLQIENVSGGGNRLDIGMLRFTDVAWMDDRTAPSVHVRHNVQGLSAIFPPAYLLSFVTDHDSEPLHDAPDLSLYFRSRMSGALGLCFRGDAFTDEENSGMAREIGIYKAARATIERCRRFVADQAGGARRRPAVGRAAGEHERTRSDRAQRGPVGHWRTDRKRQADRSPTRRDVRSPIGGYRRPWRCFRSGADDRWHRRPAIAEFGRAHADHHDAAIATALECGA